MPKIVGILNSPNQSKAKTNAFTLAEVLITLAIIGVVAALTIPSVLKNYNDKKYNTARLKALKTFGEAGKMASINGEMNSQTNATDFVNNVLSKYLKITKVCDNANECGFSTSIQPLNPSADKIKIPEYWQGLGYTYSSTVGHTTTGYTKYIMIADGFSAMIFYNPMCRTSNCTGVTCSTNIMDNTCMNVVYDMNGLKGPNHVGEDIGFVTVFWPSINTLSVAPGLIPYDKVISVVDGDQLSLAGAQNACANLGTPKNPYYLPNVYELSSIILNGSLSSKISAKNYWSSSVYKKNKNLIWNVGYMGNCQNGYPHYTLSVWCVRR